VDDNVDAAESLATLLRLDGHDVRVAHGGAAALAAAAGGALAFARRSQAATAATGDPSTDTDGGVPHAPAARPVEQVAGR
jgi:CheY-like chemotaxis protein